MNSTEPIFCRARGMASLSLTKWPLLCALLGLTTVRMAPAADSTYVNNAIINYPQNVLYPPVIDATNFINNSQFIINFTTISSSGQFPLYETSDTVNYTNNGLMMANTGFQFDNQSSATGLRTMSGTFYNPGNISSGSLTANPTATLLFGSPYDQCLVNATNVLNPGIIGVGPDGLIQITGQNVDLTRGRLNMESSGPILTGTGYFGIITDSVTNGNTIYIIAPVWDPTIYLSANTAISAQVPNAPPSPVLYPFPVLYLTNSTAYFDIQSPTISNNIISSVFIEDTSPPNVAYKVYFDTASPSSGDAIIEWAGSYLDAATGITHSNYLYLTDDYVLSATTNNGILGAIPFAFTFTESPGPLIFGTPAPAGFQNLFPSGSVTNRYAFLNAQLIPGSMGTNQVANLSVTNLTGRIQINASQKLNLALAQISGLNYLSLQSTNHFEGGPNSSIQVPYSDLNLGVTNGFLSLSNLLSPQVPIWSGNCEGWSTRWTTTSTNTQIIYTNGTTPIATNNITVTNDFRVLLVGSQFNPTAVAQVQNMNLHATNLVLSDVFNLMRSFTSDAQSLTLTTNMLGHGATSPDGEINLVSPDIFWASSLPNLRNLTNNGAIRLLNLAQFIGTSNSVAVAPAVAASAVLSNYANVLPLNKLIIGPNAYVFTNTLNNATPNLVKIAATADGTMNNLIAAINATSGAGTAYSSGTAANPQVTAGPLAAHAFTVTALASGSAGNAVQANKSVYTTNLVWLGTTVSNTLAGGMDVVTNGSSVQVPYRNLVNRGLLSDQGSEIWAANFESSGVVSNGYSGSFALQAQTARMSGVLSAGGDVSVTAASLVASNLLLEAPRSLTLIATNRLDDAGVMNGNVWVVGNQAGSAGMGIYLGTGFNVPVKPLTGDLLGTTVTSIAPSNSLINNLWAGADRGASNAGFTNNVAVGRLILNALAPALGTQFYFSGAGVSNALYVDDLELEGEAANHDGDYNLLGVNINSNLVIYYAQASFNGVPVAQKLDGKNNGHLRWVPTYAGYFSSTNIVYNGVTYRFNAALAQSSLIDSDGDGIPNSADPAPFFLPGMVNQTSSNDLAHMMIYISWNTVPLATNYVLYNPTNANGPYDLSHVASEFISPMPYPGPIANVTTNFPIIPGQQMYYKTMVYPWLTYPY